MVVPSAASVRIGAVGSYKIFRDHVAHSCWELNVLQVYIIDFGLAKKYRDPTTHQHIPYRLGSFWTELQIALSS
jgi:hypothetical protein